MKTILALSRRSVILVVFLALSVGTYSAPPDWWSQGSPPVVDPNAEQNNHGPANIGQAKWMAKSALQALRTKYPAVANEVEANLVGHGRIISDWNPPFEQATRESNHAPLLTGQLKALSAPFYDILHAHEPAWLESQLVANQTKDVANPANYYPWTVSIADDQNHAPTTVGQLKAAFSLRFSEIPDSDSDGIPDSWESAHGMNSQDASDSQGDLDGDGLTNWEEFLLGTHSNLVDSDGDGEPDGNDPDSYATESDSASSPDVAEPSSPPEQLYLNFVKKGYGEHYFEQDIYYESDLAPDHYEISTKTTTRSTVNRNYNNIYETILYRIPSSVYSVMEGCKLNAFPRFEQIEDLRLDYSRAEAPMLIPYALCGFDEISYNEPYWIYEEGGGTAESVLVRMERRKAEMFERSRTFLKIYRQHEESMALVDGLVVGIEPFVLTIPSNSTRSKAVTLEVNGSGKTCSLLPVEVVELSPKVKDEDNNDIAGSEKPNIGKTLTPFVEVDPNVNKIAHREIKVKIGTSLKDKKVTWTLEALPGAVPATIRGQWEDSPTHKDRFEASTAYDASSFRKVSQSTGETMVGADGYTAIRVNVPPIGFNQARIRVQIEGMSAPMDLIDMEVPGVVVIDPGHGGQDSGTVGIADNTILEKDLALEYSLSLKQKVIDKFNAEARGLRVIMTRKTTGEYMENGLRANLARDRGADVFLSIHFNNGGKNEDGSLNTTARGTEYVTRSSGQVNAAEDDQLGASVQRAALAAVSASDAGARHRDPKSGEFAVVSDTSYGNTAACHLVRGVIIEVEFLSHAKALESVKLSNATGVAIKTKFAADVSAEIFANILNQP